MTDDEQEPHHDGHFKCDRDDTGHSFQAEIEFHLEDGDEDDGVPSAAAIHTHVHNVPTEIVVQTLVMMAHKMMSDHLAHGAFGGSPNHLIAHSMGRAAAGAYLMNMVQNVPSDDSFMNIDIPDDASALLDGD